MNGMSNLPTATIFKSNTCMKQIVWMRCDGSMVQQLVLNPGVLGSNPARTCSKRSRDQVWILKNPFRFIKENCMNGMSNLPTATFLKSNTGNETDCLDEV